MNINESGFILDAELQGLAEHVAPGASLGSTSTETRGNVLAAFNQGAV